MKGVLPMSKFYVPENTFKETHKTKHDWGENLENITS